MQLRDGARDWAVNGKIYDDWQVPGLFVVLTNETWIELPADL